jgi:hypothetical protein
MALPSTGPISILDIANEFGGTAPFSISQYYRGGGRTDAGAPNVPTSGEISLQQFRGAAKVVPGSANFITPGTDVFVVPAYNQLIIELWGAGASGGGGFNFGNGTAGGPSTAASLGLTAGGGGGGGSRNNGAFGGAAGGASGGSDRNWVGEAGSLRSFSVPAGGRDGFRRQQGLEPSYSGDPFGTVDGGGGRAGYGNGTGGGGGGGGHVRSVYAAGAIAPGTVLTVVIGAGGPGRFDGGSGQGGAGARGRVFISWS